MFRIKPWTWIGLVAMTTLVLTACAPQPETAVTATPAPVEEPKVLRINLGTYPDIIDPQKSSSSSGVAHLMMIYEGLTRLNGDLETIPAAAEKWEYNDDTTELTFTLREGLTYSDGSVLNAKRFEYSLLRNINPETASEYAAITDEILGAPEWRMGEGDVRAQEETVKQSVQALDMTANVCTDYEQADCRILKLKLSKPAPYFHTVMSLWVAFPAKEENIVEGGENWWNNPKYQIGNGPYVLKSLGPSVRGYFVPNENYWAGVGKVDIEYSYVTDSAVAFQAYKNDEFDMITLVPEDLATVKADPELSKEALIYPSSCTFGVRFHHLKEPFTDPKVRQAFAMAVDREAVVRDVLKGLGNSTLTWIPEGYPGHKEGETRWGFDPQAARKAIAESSYSSVDNLPKVALTFPDTPRNRVRHEWLVVKWKETLGVDVELNPVEPTTYSVLFKDPGTTPQMFVMGWCADYPDPQNWLSVCWHSDSSFAARTAYANPDFDALVNEADATVDPVKRMELYQKAQDLLVDSVPAIFMWNSVNAYLVKPWVKGLDTTPQDEWPGWINPIGIDMDTLMMP
jgi:oligopeptide transport system substrate-binding protein